MNIAKQTQRRRYAIKSLSLLVSAMLYAGTVFANNTIDIRLPAQPLDQSLHHLAQQTGAQILFTQDITANKKAKSINGSLTVEQALQQLLQGTGLTIKDNGNNSFSIVAAAGQQSRDMGKLKTIDVSASGSRAGNSNVAQLPVITVNAEQDGSANDGYLVKKITGVGIWGERSLQDTPYSMSIVSSDLIENVVAKDMNQIFKMNPTTQERGQSSSNVGDVQWPNIRGFRVQNPIINGISYANYISSAPMMQDIDRVEIINGATGFLYGGGRVGGAVNYVTKKPTIEDLKSVTLGSYGKESYYGHLDLGGQFDQNNTFGYRANIMYQDGELSDTSETEQKAMSLVLDWKPTDNFYTDTKYVYKNSLKKGVGTFFTSIDNRSSIKENKVYNPNWLQNEVDSNKLENNINWKINDIFSLRTNVFYEKIKYRGDVSWITYKNNKIVGNQTNIYSYAWEETENNGFNLFLDSKFDTGSINHTLTAGYSLNSSKLSLRDNNYNSYTPTNDLTLTELKNLAKPEELNWGAASDSGVLKPSSKKQYSNIVLGDNLTFNDQWSALVGINYATVINNSYSTTPKYDKSALTPTLSLIYKPFQDLTTYATYIESLEAGTVVGSTYQNKGEILDPYISTQYELGAKYSFNDNILLTGALFRMEKANSYSDNVTTPPTLTQDGQQVHQGIELGVTGKLTNDLTIIAGGTLMDLSVEKHSNKAIEGKKPSETASKMAKIYAEYNVPYTNGFTITGGAFYTGEKYANAANTDIMPAYTLFDIGFRYSNKIGQYPTTFNLNVQNLTNKMYWTNSWQLGDPRTVAFSVKTQF